jgi:hypothetical protein
MAEISTWSALIRLTATTVNRFLPNRVLRWRWPDQRIVQAIHAVHYEQWPRFYVRQERDLPELQYVGFNLFNLSPLRFWLVGADLRVTVDSSEWLTYSQRLPSETPMPPYGRSGLQFARPLTSTQAQRLREYPCDWVPIRIGGYLIFRSSLGEIRKEIHSDVVATIDRQSRSGLR